MKSMSQPKLVLLSSLLGTLASWSVLMLLLLTYLGLTNEQFIHVLIICGLLWVATVVVCFPLRCPTCEKRICFSNSVSVKLNLAMAREQYFPIRAFIHKQIDCPHCGTSASLQDISRTLPQPSAEPRPQSLLDLLRSVLNEQGFGVTETGDCLTLASGIELRVELLETVDLARDQVRSSTRTLATHPLYWPAGLPEFQHALGTSVEHAISQGFANWARMDLITLEDALRDKPEVCTFWDMEYESTPDAPARTRRLVFGPTEHMAAPAIHPQHEEHPYCPCCLVTKNFDAFRSLMESDETLGIRLFASRNENDQVCADCRVNGEEYEEGENSLAKYAGTWPATAGMEFRKQYVLIRTIAQFGQK